MEMKLNVYSKVCTCPNEQNVKTAITAQATSNITVCHLCITISVFSVFSIFFSIFKARCGAPIRCKITTYSRAVQV